MRVNGTERAVVLAKNIELASDTTPETVLGPQDATALAGLLAPVLPEFIVEAFGPAPQRVVIRSEASVSLEFLPVTEGVNVFGTVPGVVFSPKDTLPSSLVGTLDYSSAPLRMEQVVVEGEEASFQVTGADVTQVVYQQLTGPAAQVGQVFLLEGAAAGQYVVVALPPAGVVFDRPLASTKPVGVVGRLGWPAFRLHPVGVQPTVLEVDPGSPAAAWFFQSTDALRVETKLTTLRFSRADFPFDEEYAVVVDQQLHRIESRSTEGPAVFLEIAPGVAPTFAKDLAASTPPSVTFVHRAEADYQARSTFLSGWQEGFGEARLKLTRALAIFLVSPTPTNRGNVLVAAQLLRTGAQELAVAMRAGVGKSTTQVRELFRSLREKGLDRAIELLKTGRFAEFFDLTAEEGSTGGHLAAQIRTMAQQDLTQTRFDRSTRSRLRATLREPDAEFTSADIDALGVTADEPLP
jgi:hypothetical protein